MENTLNILSYNVWGIFVAKDTHVRMKLIGERLANSNYDVVCLQEQFNENHFPLLFPKGSQYCFTHRFVSSPYVGSGLVIASRFPIQSNLFIPFHSQGRPERVWEGDFFANKGVSISRLIVPRKTQGESAELIIFNTHMIASYGEQPNFSRDPNASYRLSQMLQLAEIIANCVKTNYTTHFVITGDLNCGLTAAHGASPEFDFLFAHLKNKGILLRSSVPSVTGKADKGNANLWSNCHDNCYTSNKGTVPLKERIDHIIYGTYVGASGIGELLSAVKASELVFTEKVQDPQLKQKAINYSDHYGVALGLNLKQEKLETLNPINDQEKESLKFAASTFRRCSSELQHESFLFSLSACVILGINFLAASGIFSSFGSEHMTEQNMTSDAANVTRVLGLAVHFISVFGATLMLIIGFVSRRFDAMNMAEDLNTLEDKSLIN